MANKFDIDYIKDHLNTETDSPKKRAPQHVPAPLGDTTHIAISSVKGVKGKVTTRIDVDSDEINWTIKFNIPLNPATVNDENMDVTDLSGYTITSDISYHQNDNAILLSPIEPIKPNATYILNVSTDVCSQGGNNLKEPVQVVFKLVGSEIGNFKILKGKDRLDIDIKPSRYMPTETQRRKDKLPIIGLGINIWVGVGALVLFVLAVLFRSLPMMLIGIVMIIFAIAHLVYQLVNRNTKSRRIYNKGAAFYNDGEYGDAKEAFEEALSLNPLNQFAKRGIMRLSGNSAYIK